jgi:hypothetical protein
MYWTLQNLEDSESKQLILHYGSIFSAATVYSDGRNLRAAIRPTPLDPPSGLLD